MNSVEFDEKLRNNARGDNNIKSAFNDFFIKNLIVRKDGGFLMAADLFLAPAAEGVLTVMIIYTVRRFIVLIAVIICSILTDTAIHGIDTIA